MALRSEKTVAVIDRIQSTYGGKYDPMLMFNSQRDVSEILDEGTEAWSVCKHLQKKQEQKAECKNTIKKHEQER